MNQYFRHYLLLALCLGTYQLMGYGHAHYYRATDFFSEPRLDRDYLSTFDFFVQGGSTSKARNKDHTMVPLFDIYGTNDMHELGAGVPGKNLSNPLDLILQQLELLPSRCATSADACKKISKFANFSINANFSTLEAILSISQNIKRGFFINLYFPIRQIKVDDIRFCDISPTDDTCPNINTPIWQAFKTNFDDILARYCLKQDCYNKTNIGDISLLLGWTYSFQKTEVLDFVDTTFKLGMLIPSGKEKCEDQIFSIPFGYNGHIGAIISGDLAFGAFDWLTLGMHFDALVFASKTKCIRLKTGQFQSGVIKLAKGETKIERGSLWEAGGYIKFDHFIHGLSFLLGYSFVNKNRDEVTPCDVDTFNVSVANSDSSLFNWKMHTLNFIIEYDFAREDKIVGPRIAAFYNFVAGGKRIFTTGIGGGNLGIEVAWDI